MKDDALDRAGEIEGTGEINLGRIDGANVIIGS